MKKQNLIIDSNKSDHGFEPFPEPRTVPDGWDLSGLFYPSQESVISPVSGTRKTEIEN